MAATLNDFTAGLDVLAAAITDLNGNVTDLIAKIPTALDYQAQVDALNAAAASVEATSALVTQAKAALTPVPAPEDQPVPTADEVEGELDNLVNTTNQPENQQTETPAE